MQHGFKQSSAVGLGGGELGFQLVAQRHQLIDFGDDAVLFGEGWQGYCQCSDVRGRGDNRDRTRHLPNYDKVGAEKLGATA